jgi:hypothetical protein
MKRLAALTALAFALATPISSAQAQQPYAGFKTHQGRWPVPHPQGRQAGRPSDDPNRRGSSLVIDSQDRQGAGHGRSVA